MKKNYLITGACGFIGSNFVNYMYNKYGKDINIVVLDKLDYCASVENIDKDIRDNVEIVIGDIGDTNLVMYILRKFDINLVINFSAYSHVDNSFFNSIEFTKNNVLQTHYFLETIRLYQQETQNITKFIHVSTDEVYGSVEDNKERLETSILDPTNPYASSKACAEMIVKSYWYSYKLPIIITRSNNVYGKNQYPEKLIPKFIKHIINGEKMPIQGNGETRRHYIHVDDVCSAFDILIDKGVIGEIYNISADKSNEYSVRDIAIIILNKFYKSYEERNYIEYVKDRNFNDLRYYISSAKLESLGWKCNKTNFIDELDDIIVCKTNEIIKDNSCLIPDRKFKLLKNNGITSYCYIDDKKEYFIKIPYMFNDFDILKREIQVLKTLNDNKIEWCPKLLYSNDKLLVTNYCGGKLTNRNIPDDYKIQINKILEDMNRLNIKHNDIINTDGTCELLVKNNKLYLIDFGWASINDKYDCGISIDNRSKIGFIYIDSSILSILDGIYTDKLDIKIDEDKQIPYKNSNRIINGSQSEVPMLNIEHNKITVSGYQQYMIMNGVLHCLSKSHKYNKMYEILYRLKKDCNTINDVGCSNGLVSMMGNIIGYDKIYALDHDIECINLINTVKKLYNYRKIIPQEYSFGDNMEKTDIFIMLALIHWIYSCTSLYGNFTDIFTYIKKYVKKYLLIEWVEPEDGAIKSFSHINYNKSIITEEYNRVNFENGLSNIIGDIIEKIELEKNRILYIVKV